MHACRKGTMMFKPDSAQLKAITEAQQAWVRDILDPALSRAAEQERNAGFSTMSGVPVQRLYTPVDVAGTDPIDDIGFPGQFPFTRGVHPTGYRGKLWTMRMFAGFGTAEETNTRFRYLLAHGQSGLSVAFD